MRKDGTIQHTRDRSGGRHLATNINRPQKRGNLGSDYMRTESRRRCRKALQDKVLRQHRIRRADEGGFECVLCSRITGKHLETTTRQRTRN